MRSHFSPCCGLSLLGLAVAIALTNVSFAEQKGTKNALDALKEDKERGPFMSGTKVVDAANKKAAKNVAEGASQYYLFRITHRIYESAKVHKDFTDDIDRIVTANKKNENKGYINLLGPALVASMKDVLAAQDMKRGEDRPIVLNAAMMLPTMARLKQDDVGAYLVELVNDVKTPEMVRLYALKGLKEFMPIVPQPDPLTLDITDKKQNARRAQDALYVNALTKFIEAKGSMSQGEIDAVRYLRREAIISLAQAGSPAVLAADKRQVKKDVLEGPVAPTLLRVLTKGELQPPPSLQEKVEAALGLCYMKHANMPEYNPEVATYLIAETLVEFTQAYNVDLVNFSRPGVGKKLPFLPWKADAKRLTDGLKEHAKNGNPRSLELHKEAIVMLSNFSKYESAQQLDTFRQKVPEWRPGNAKVFKTVK